LESISKEENWCLGYISILDFVIYEMINQISKFLPEKIQCFKKLLNVRNKVYELPEIKAYENSEKSIK
jgi:hypothetical protein